MSYKNKTYVCFDADNDMWAYAYMLGWDKNEHIEFNFHNAHEINNLRDGSTEDTIKAKLRERLKNTKVLVVLIGGYTKNLYKYVRWEIEYAIENAIPIIAVNINDKRKKDKTLCPPILNDKLAVHISFRAKILDHALNNWPAIHKIKLAKEDKNDYYYLDSVYKSLDL
ncbi:MAG: TIR domain-containing protein [Ignavibacteriae bacterium]|nr:TIR domain-containing protein [Ignavibacteriota bacterium]